MQTEIDGVSLYPGIFAATKKCLKCNAVKEVGEFCVDRRETSGYRATCKKCFNLYRKGKYGAKIKAVEIAPRMRSYFGRKLEYIQDQDARKFPTYRNDLIVDDLVEIFERHKGTCVYSGEKLCPTGPKSVFKTVSFDRINNAEPHHKDNLQLTSIYFNKLRGDMTHADFAKYWQYY